MQSIILSYLTLFNCYYMFINWSFIKAVQELIVKISRSFNMPLLIIFCQNWNYFLVSAFKQCPASINSQLENSCYHDNNILKLFDFWILFKILLNLISLTKDFFVIPCYVIRIMSKFYLNLLLYMVPYLL